MEHHDTVMSNSQGREEQHSTEEQICDTGCLLPLSEARSAEKHNNILLCVCGTKHQEIDNNFINVSNLFD